MKLIMPAALVLSLFFSGCTRSTPASTNQTSEQAPVTTLVGTVSQNGSRYVLQEKNGKTTEIASYTIKLSDYVGKAVTGSGQYSGTTLYIDTIISK